MTRAAVNRLEMEDWSRLVGLLYETAADADEWPAVLATVAKAFGAKSAVLRTVRVGQHRDVHATYHYNMHDPLQQAYEGGLVRDDPYLEVLNRVPTGRMITNDNMIDLDAMRHTAFYQQYMRPLDNHFIVGGILERHEDEAFSLIGLHRHQNAEPFSRHVLAALQATAPHLRRALWLQRMMQRSIRRAEAAEVALEGIGVACLLVDDSGRLTHANGHGEALLRDDPRIRVTDGRLFVATPDCSCLFQPLAELLPRPEARPQSTDQPLLLRSPDGQAPHLAVIAGPRPGPVNGSNTDRAFYVGNLDETGVLNATLLRELYGLTPTEARLAVGLGRGYDLGEIAVRWSVSRETLRTHLKRLLSKTGTSRQTELVRLMCGRPWKPTDEDAGTEP